MRLAPNPAIRRSAPIFGLVAAVLLAGCGSDPAEHIVVAPTVVEAAPSPPPSSALLRAEPKKELLDRIDRRALGRWLSGSWSFSHGGEPWFQAKIKVVAGEVITTLTFNPDISWVSFEIRDIRTTEGPKGTVIVMHGVDEGGTTDTRKISLRAKSRSLLVGEVFGDHYDEAIGVRAVRR